jgi:hypothetical protein
MNTQKSIAPRGLNSFFVAWGLFVVSMLLPAADSFYGWQCAAVCAMILKDAPVQIMQVYYFLFTITNVVMLLSVPLFFSRKKIATWMIAVAGVSVLYVLSFLVVAAKSEFPLRIGYYVWLASFFVLAGELLRLMKGNKVPLIATPVTA